MTPEVRALIQSSVISGVVVSVVALIAALAGLGITAFWVAIGFGAPLSLLVDEVTYRRLKIPSPWARGRRRTKTSSARDALDPNTASAERERPPTQTNRKVGKAHEYIGPAPSHPFAERVEADLHAWSELDDALGTAVNALPERQKLVVALYYFERLSTVDVADVLDVAPHVVRELLEDANARTAERKYSLEEWSADRLRSRPDAPAHKFAAGMLQRTLAQVGVTEQSSREAFFIACEYFAEVDMLAPLVDPATMQSSPDENLEAYADLLGQLWQSTVGALTGAVNAEITLRTDTQGEAFEDARARITWQLFSSILDEAPPSLGREESSDLLPSAAINLLRSASAVQRGHRFPPGDASSLVDMSFFLVWHVSRIFQRAEQEVPDLRDRFKKQIAPQEEPISPRRAKRAKRR